MDEQDIINIRLQALHVAVLAIAATMPDDHHKQMLAAFEIKKSYFLAMKREQMAELPDDRQAAIYHPMEAYVKELEQLQLELDTATETAHWQRAEIQKRQT